MAQNPGKFALLIEFFALFVALPCAYFFGAPLAPRDSIFWKIAASPLPGLALMAYYCYTRLRSDPLFERTRLWSADRVGQFAPSILVTFAIIALLIGVGVWMLAPERLFSFVRSNPRFWAVIMCFYPVLSVYPQSLIYRAFLFQRYRSILSSERILVVISAVVFSFAHIIFRNPIALVFTLVGGWLFANRYRQSRSLFVSAFEHSLYGCFMFTIGLGTFFYHGAALPR